jgi:hypothetical protein
LSEVFSAEHRGKTKSVDKAVSKKVEAAGIGLDRVSTDEHLADSIIVLNA